MQSEDQYVQSGPYGGPGGDPVNEWGPPGSKVRKVIGWNTRYNNYDVVGAIQLNWPGQAGPIAGTPEGNPVTIELDDNELITEMQIYSGDGEGYVDHIHFDTNKGKHFDIGGPGGARHDVNVGNGDWMAAVADAGGCVDDITVFFGDQ
ncbi:hypothetical protein BBP40_002392 [Aspergillus hancockii]|nr:hypothetical protein BBP40_002392 [Aspergillus hancockii]